MKKYVLITIAIAGLVVSSCKDFIAEDVKSNVVAEEFYLTEDGYESLINATYSTLKGIYGGDAWLFTVGTDIMAEAAGRGDEPDGLSQYISLNPSSNGVSHLYVECFKAIEASNTALYYADITEQTSQLTNRVGEAEYLRANAYFVLVQTYGGVSILTDLVDSPILEVERNTAEEVYMQIIADLESALNKVSTSSYGGRVNKRAVQHLLAKVYLTRGYESFGTAADFTSAAQMADTAIGGQGLNLSFEELWDPTNDMNEETIFSVQYSTGATSANTTGSGSSQAYWFGAYLGGDEVDGDAPRRSYTQIATEHMQKLFVEGDERWDATFMTEIFSRYYDYHDVDDHSALAVTDFYEPQWFTMADSLDYVNNNILDDSFDYHSFGDHWAQGVSGDYESITVKKFDDPDAPFATRGSTRDIVISRVAETYLIAAEAYLQAGNAGTALDRLNVVRDRAGVADATVIDVDVVLDERALELFGEYHRWFDLKRTGKLVERATMHNYLIDSESNFNGANGELKILRPIPQSAIDLNQNMDFPQNPAYE